MQGLAWAADSSPPGAFNNPNVEAEKHYMEAESMRTEQRPERVLWLGVQIARGGVAPIEYDDVTHRFALTGAAAQAEEAGGSGVVVREGLKQGGRGCSECTTETLAGVEMEMSDAEMGDSVVAAAGGVSESFLGPGL